MTGPLDPGSTFAGYRIEGVIGRGGMGVVYRATDVALDRTVALKLVAPELAGDAGFRDRFLRESRLAAAIEHPHILPVHAAGEADGALYLVMRFVDGEDLRSRLAREGRLAPPAAVALAGQIAGALDAAHANGLVHRDVKPGNVLIGSGGEGYLCDFGLTKPMAADRSVTESGQFLGTLDYVAPEQIEGGEIDGRADQYALGCVLYECLAGRPPFDGSSGMAVMWAHMHEAAPSLHEHRLELPAALDGVIRRALAKSPDSRYGSCAEFVDSAQSVVGSAGGSSVPRRRFRASFLLLAAALVVAAAVVAALLAGRGEEVGPSSAPAPAAPAVEVVRNSVVAIDPETNEVVSGIPVGNLPSSIAVGEGAVWVLNGDDRTVSRIDPETTAERRFSVGATPTGLAVGEGALWVANGFEGTVSRVDPASTLVEGEIALPEPPPPRADHPANDVAVGSGSVWVTGPGLAESGSGRSAQPFVWRIDPSANEVVASVRGAGGVALAADADAVWSASFADTARTRPVNRCGDGDDSAPDVGVGRRNRRGGRVGGRRDALANQPGDGFGGGDDRGRRGSGCGG